MQELKFLIWLNFFKRVQKNFEGKLIGADRAKDLAVLKAMFVFVLWMIVLFIGTVLVIYQQLGTDISKLLGRSV